MGVLLDSILGPTGSNLRQYLGNTLGDLSYGLANSTNFGNAFGAASMRQSDMQPARDLAFQQAAKDAADKADREAKIKQSAMDLQKWPDLVKYVTDTGDTAGAFSEAFKRGAPGYGDPNWGRAGPQPSTDIQNYEYSLSHPGFGDFQTQKGGASETALQPVWGTDARGNPVLGQLNKAGQFIQTALPDGVTAMGPGETAGARAGATVDAKTAANARASLQSAQQAFDVTQQTINALQTNPSVMAGQKENFSKFGGIVPQQMLPSLPGTNRANFKNIVDQLSGQAFLNIRQALKGAGQVTDYEGQKGEIALSRMKAAADSGDEQAFMQSVADYQDAINNGMELLRQTANGSLAAGQPAVTGGPGPGKVLTYNPTTGELE